MCTTIEQLYTVPSTSAELFTRTAIRLKTDLYEYEEIDVEVRH